MSERFDEYGGLDRHMQRTCYSVSFQWLLSAVFLAQAHQARHFLFGDIDFFSAPFGKIHVCNLVGKVLSAGRHEILLYCNEDMVLTSTGARALKSVNVTRKNERRFQTGFFECLEKQIMYIETAPVGHTKVSHFTLKVK